MSDMSRRYYFDGGENMKEILSLSLSRTHIQIGGEQNNEMDEFGTRRIEIEGDC